MVFLPRDPAARAACEREIERAIANEGQELLGWRDVPVDDRSLGETARSDDAGDPPGLRGRGPRPARPRRLRAQALHHPQEPRPRHPRARAFERARLLRAVVLAPHHRLQGHAARRAGRQVLHATSATSASSRRCASRTSASRPTPSPRGTSRTRSASSRTTARSTRCAATSTGSARARRRSTRSCWARTSTRSGRSSTTASRTRPRSTTRSSCSSWAATRSPTR